MLTKKEKEILKYILSGFSDPGIAKIMWLSQATVRTHVHRIYEKYGIKKNKIYNQRVLLVSNLLLERSKKNERIKNIETGLGEKEVGGHSRGRGEISRF